MLITEIQKFCTHDGPGLRTVVFFKGCPLDCLWCHNPETKSPRQQLFFTSGHCIFCGGCISVCENRCHSINENEHIFNPSSCVACGNCAAICPTDACELVAENMSIVEITDAVLRDRDFYGEHGGVTLSGGEPLIHPEAAELLAQCKKSGINTAVETCGYISADLLKKAIAVTDLFLWDIKGGNRERHFENTGVYPEKILDNLLLTDSLGGSTVLRCIAVEGRNMFDDDISRIADIYGKLTHCKGVEILPYHAYGASKAVQLGIKDNGHTEWIPSKERMQAISDALTNLGVKILNNTK